MITIFVGTIDSTPTGPEAFRLLALKSALKLEILGMKHSSGRRASVTVRDILDRAGWPTVPTKLKPLLAQYEDYLRSLNVLS